MAKLSELLEKAEAKATNIRHAAMKVKPQPDADFGARCVSFHRRMLASVVDTFIISMTILPVSYALTTMLVGAPNMNFDPMILDLSGEDDPAIRAQIIQDFLTQDGRMQYFYLNTLIQLTALFAYCMICWKYWAATPGKWVARCKVLDATTGQNLTYMQGFWRCVGYIISSMPLCLGIVWVSFQKQRQGWHDMLANTVVVEMKKQADTTQDQ